jgi:serine/threonine-protein kinase
MQVGATLSGRYRLDRVIGTGGMGIVFAASDLETGTAVAVKCLKHPDANARRRLLVEARASAAVRHPAVVRVLQVLDLEEGPAIILELLEGESLGARLAREGVLSLGETARLLVHVCDALDAAHALGIVHRDLKPDNIFLVRDSSTRDPAHPVKVLDFGLAKLTAVDGEAQASVGLSTTNALVGTPMYMAPEQVYGDLAPDARIDVWALGLIVFECLTGILPTRAGNVGHVLRKILSDTLPRIEDVDPEVPADVAAEVNRMLARQREDRPARATAIRAVLLRYATAAAPPPARTVEDAEEPSRVVPPPPARADSGARPSATPPRRASWIAPVAVAAALAITSVAVWASRSSAPSAASASATASVSASATTSAPNVALGLLDAPPPVSTSAEAIALYRAALGELRDGALVGYQRKLEQALKLDPSFAAAHVRLATMSGPDTVEVTREHLEKARAGREKLLPRDLDVLRLIELDMVGNDPAATIRRADELIDARPDDAELRWIASALAFDFGDGPAACKHAEALVALDHGAAIGQWLLGMAGALQGDEEAAHRATTTCSELAPASTACRSLASMVARASGRCAELGEHAQQLIGGDGNPRRFDARIDALLQDEPEPSQAVVLELLAQKWPHVEPARRALIEAMDRARLGLAYGDFSAAAKGVDTAAGLAAPSSDQRTHALVAKLAFDVATEVGDAPGARRAVTDFAVRWRGWTRQTPRLDFLGVGGDDTLMLLAAARRAGAVTDAEYIAARTEWIGSIKSSAPLSLVWLVAHALPAATPKEAEEAIAARAAFVPETSLYLPARALVAAEGRARLLSGDVSGAAAALRRGAAACVAWSDPADHLRAFRDLASALAAAGDKPGACAAVDRVLARWGHARPRSVTAEDASRIAKRVGCAPKR